jgi:glyoxylase-like metal-dependent hydrolase (beta-lactamase superfamily II)
MSGLVFLSERAAYLPGTNNLGVIVASGNRAIAVDAGIDKEAARLLRRACEVEQLTLTAVISTHHHADHVGGNDYLVRNIPGMTVYAPRREAAFIEDPYLEPMYLSLGATPLAALRNKFVYATAAPVHQRIDAGQLRVLDVPLTIVDIPGHSLAQVAVVVDDVCYAADGFFGARVLAKYGVPYAHDVAAQVASFDVLTRLPVAHWVPGHGDVVDRAGLDEAIGANLAAIQQSRLHVLTAIKQAQTLPAVVATVQAALAMPSASIAQYAVFASGIAAYLQWLVADGAAVAELTDAGLVWRAL